MPGDVIRLEPPDLVVALSRGERLAALRRGDPRVPLATVRDATVVPDGLAAAHGLRAPGLAIPGRVKIGTWRGRGGPRFVVVRRGVPAVRVEHAGGEVIVSEPDAEAVADAIRAAAGIARRERLAHLPGGLEGLLTLPAGAGPFPAALLLSGSGELDRDGDDRRLPLGISRALAHALAARGVASLRFDKRGVGASAGDFFATGFSEHVEDARAALGWLRARPETGLLFAVGHSEGALLAGRLGGEGLAGVVLLAGFATTGDAALRRQGELIAESLPRLVGSVARRRQAATMAKLRASREDVVRIGGVKFPARAFRELLDEDAGAALAALDAPILAVTGAKDLQVDPAELSAIAAAAAGPVETVRVPNLTHVLRRDFGPPSLTAYRRLVRGPVDPEVAGLVADWIVRRG